MGYGWDMKNEITSLPVKLSFSYSRTGVPSLVLGNGSAGWTVKSFENSLQAAKFFLENQFCAMPCWERFAVVNGLLVIVK